MSAGWATLTRKYNSGLSLTVAAEQCRPSGRPLLKKREKWRTPSYFASRFKDNPRYTFR
jgi:hypothetical protein